MVNRFNGSAAPGETLPVEGDPHEAAIMACYLLLGGKEEQARLHALRAVYLLMQARGARGGPEAP